MRLPVAGGNGFITQVLRGRSSPISLPVIAAAAGVSVSTVSRSLNDDPQIPLETRRRVSQIAREMGYRKNASITALMRSFRVGGRSGSRQEVLAFLSSYGQAEWSNKYLESHGRFLSAIRDRAANLGYRVDVFWTQEPGLSLARLGGILRARGIRGVILGPMAEKSSMEEFPWKDFASVVIGYGMLESPRLHRVQSDMHENMSLILHQFQARGYQRIGFVTHEAVEERSGRLAEAAFALYLRQIPARNRIPILAVGPRDRAALKGWLRKYQPDAVVSQGDLVLEQVKSHRRRDGGPIGFAWLAAQVNTPEVSGTVLHQEALGTAAFDLLVSLVASGDKGIPKDPRSILIPGHWRDGNTTSSPPA